VGLIVGLMAGLSLLLGLDQYLRLNTKLIVVFIYGLIGGFTVGLIFGLRGSRQSLENDIQTVEALSWSWSKALKSGLVGGLIGGPLGSLIVRLYGEWIYQINNQYGDFPIPKPHLESREWLFVGIIFGVSAGLVSALFGGVSRAIAETKSAPNQGIRLSIRNAFYGGLISGLCGWLCSRLFSMLTHIEQIDLLSFGLLVASIGALWYGGLDIIQHYTLRLILIIQNHTPANYASLLDYAVDRIFLQRVGGGYRFIHRLLLEHLANRGKR